MTFGKALGGRGTIVAIAVVGVGATALALLMTIRLAFQGATPDSFTLANLGTVFADPFVAHALLNTLGFALVTGLTAFAFGVPIAWLAERTDLPGRAIVMPLMTIGLLVPGFFNAMGWLLLLHPRMGMINVWLMQGLHLASAPLSVVSVAGMGVVQGLGLATLMFVMCAAAFRAQDATLEESAQVHGLRFVDRLVRITLPLMWPSLLAAGIYVFMVGLAVFDVPAVIGLTNRIYTYSTFVYDLTNPSAGGRPNYGVAGASSLIVILLAGLLGTWYFRVVRRSRRYAVVTGKGYRPAPFRLGRRAIGAWAFIAAYLTLSLGLPGCVLLWASFLPYFAPFSAEALARVSLANYATIPWAAFWHAALNSAIVMISVPTITLTLSLAISWVVVRSGLRVARAFDVLAFLPLAIPSVVFAVGAAAIAIFWLPPSIPFYGTVGILIAVQVIVQLSFGTRVLNNALLQIHRDLDDAGATFGLRTVDVIWHVLRPLVGPALLSAWLWMGLLAYRELTVAMMLVTDKNITLPVFIWGVYSEGQIGQAAALTILLGCAIVPLIVAYFAVARRGTAPA